MITIWNKSLFLFLSSSWSTPWGVFTGIFLHGSPEHFTGNILGLSFFFYLYTALVHTSSPELLTAKTRFIIIAPFAVAVLANVLSLPQSGTSAGASGFVFALAGIVFTEAVKNILYRKPPSNIDEKDQRVFLATNLLIITYFAVNLFLFDKFFNVSSGVNYFAHEWAFGLGIISTFIFTS
jgi:membrane associated rhomboid family serine protease